VGINGSTVVVGAYSKNSGTGAAYVFGRSGTVWSQQAELIASDGAAGDEFGLSAAIYGSTVVIGAPYKSSSVGAAYVFGGSGTTWSQQAELTSATGDVFGYAVAVYGSTVVVGSYAENSETGAAYVFVRSGTAWSQQAKLTASDAAAIDEFGASVALYGSTVVIGAPNKNNGVGAAYLFERSGTAWSQQAEVTASDASTGNEYAFGTSVAIYGSTALIGAPSGAAYMFARSGTAWSQQADLTPSDATNNYFGESVTIYRSTAVVGASGTLAQTGAAYTFGNL
jgi:hypothetical protein